MNTKVFCERQLIALTEASNSPDVGLKKKKRKSSTLSEVLLLVRSLFCAYLVGFVLHDLSPERFWFPYLVWPPRQYEFTSTARKGRIQCLHAEIALVSQPARKSCSENQKRKKKNKNSVKRGTYTVWFEQITSCVWSLKVYLVQISQFGNRCTECML